LIAGVGVYFHPGGNRFEGNFFNNKPVSIALSCGV
jgi:hypothetical protein